MYCHATFQMKSSRQSGGDCRRNACWIFNSPMAHITISKTPSHMKAAKRQANDTCTCCAKGPAFVQIRMPGRSRAAAPQAALQAQMLGLQFLSCRCCSSPAAANWLEIPLGPRANPFESSSGSAGTEAAGTALAHLGRAVLELRWSRRFATNSGTRTFQRRGKVPPSQPSTPKRAYRSRSVFSQQSIHSSECLDRSRELYSQKI